MPKHPFTTTIIAPVVEGMNTSFFFGWKAAILSAISSRAVNLPEITKLGVMNEEQKMDDKRTTKSPSH